ncbi:MAG: hypothetical protein R3C02_07935 [Planctomycetaceae bacterium]
MVVRDLQVVLGGDELTVADPLTDHVHRELFGQFGLPGGPQVLERLRPHLEPGPADELAQQYAVVGIHLAVAGDDELRSFLSHRVAFIEVRHEFREQRNHT